MEIPIKMHDLGGKPTILGNPHIFSNTQKNVRLWRTSLKINMQLHWLIPQKWASQWSPCYFHCFQHPMFVYKLSPWSLGTKGDVWHVSLQKVRDVRFAHSGNISTPMIPVTHPFHFDFHWRIPGYLYKPRSLADVAIKSQDSRLLVRNGDWDHSPSTKSPEDPKVRNFVLKKWTQQKQRTSRFCLLLGLAAMPKVFSSRFQWEKLESRKTSNISSLTLSF